MRDKLREAIRAHQHGSAAENYGLAMAEVLEAVLLGAAVPDALSSALGTAPAGAQVAMGAAIGHAHASHADLLQVCSFLYPAIRLSGSMLTTIGGGAWNRPAPNLHRYLISELTVSQLRPLVTAALDPAAIVTNKQALTISRSLEVQLVLVLGLRCCPLTPVAT